MTNKYLKKFKIFMITIILTLFVFSCYKFLNECLDLHIYVGWQEINLDETVSFKVPGNWKKGEKNGLIYFYDTNLKDKESSLSSPDDNILFFQSNSKDYIVMGNSINEIGNTLEMNILGDDFQSVAHINGTVNSLGVVYGSAIVSVNDTTYLENYIESDDILFYSWVNRVDEHTLKKIADSFN